MDHAYLESTVSDALTDALKSLSLVMAKSSSPSHPIIDPIDYVGRFLLHRCKRMDFPLHLQAAIDTENNVISKYYEIYHQSHPQEPTNEKSLEVSSTETHDKASNLNPQISVIDEKIEENKDRAGAENDSLVKETEDIENDDSKKEEVAVEKVAEDLGKDGAEVKQVNEGEAARIEISSNNQEDDKNLKE